MLQNTSRSGDQPVSRAIARVVATPPPAPGFIGEGHTAVEVLKGVHLRDADPFVLLMDDRLEIAERRKIGDAHPHAGLETVTLVLEGSVHDRDEGVLAAGEVAWMTAGRGIVHSEHVEAEGRVRILQLWIGLPAESRGAAPALQIVRGASVKTFERPGVSVRLYSGSSGPLRSPTRNLVPVTLAEIRLDAAAEFAFELPPRHAGFVYAVSGSFAAGSGATPVTEGDVAWLEGDSGASASELAFTAGPDGGRLVIYAGQAHGEPLVQRGPFVAESEYGIATFFREYRNGRFQRLSELHRQEQVAPSS